MLLKFERMEPLGRWFAERLVEVAKREAIGVDIVVPVPLHRQRERERGYNQADLIAKPLARRLGLIVAAFPLPLAVKGYWNHDVDPYGFAPRNLY